MNFSLTEQERFFQGSGAEYLNAKPSWKPFMKKGTPPRWCRDRMVDVKHIKLVFKPDFKNKSFEGECTLTVAPINENCNFLELDACEMDISSVKVDGKKVDWHHDGQKLTVEFGRDIKPDQNIDITTKYSATPRRAVYFVGPDKAYPDKHQEMWTQGQDEDSRYWFPCFDYPNERATSEIIAYVPKGMTSFSNGELVKESTEGKWQVHHWKHETSHVAYLVSLVIGDYKKFSDEWDGIPVTYYVPPNRAADGKRAFGRTAEMVKFYSDKIGVRYPYAKYGQITAADFIFGGMENTTATTQTELTLHDKRASIDFSSEPLVCHELAHQWFGDYLSCRDWSHAWLNESFATYFEAMWCEESLGDDEFKYYLDADWRAYLMEDAGSYRRPIQTNIYVEPLDLFDRHLYQKGGVILHHLRNILGDRLWWKVINHYVVNNADASVITQDFATSLEEVTGRNFDWFLDQWIFGGGHPAFKVKAKWDQKSKQVDFTVLQTQKKDELTAIFRTPLTVKFAYEGGEEVREMQIDKAAHRYTIKLPKRPLWISFDPGNSIPKTLTLDLSEDMLIAALENDDCVMGRIHAVRALSGKPTLKSTRALKTALYGDKFWGVQAEAAKALGKVHTEEALTALLAKTVKHAKARRAVASALGEWRDDRAAKKLVEMLKKDESYFVEASAAFSLGKTRDKTAFAALKRALSKDSHTDVIRNHIFNGFVALRDMRALEIMSDWTIYGKSQQARYAAIAALGRLAGQSTEDSDKEMARETIEPLLEGDFRQVLSAVSGLASLKDPKAVGALRKLARTSHDSRIKKRAADAASAIGAAQGSAKQVTELKDEHEKLKTDYEKLIQRLDKLENKDDSKPAKKSVKKTVKRAANKTTKKSMKKQKKK